MKSVINISIFGYGFKINYFPYDGINDGSLSKFGIEHHWGKWSNPSVIFIFNYRWLSLHLLLDRE